MIMLLTSARLLWKMVLLSSLMNPSFAPRILFVPILLQLTGQSKGMTSTLTHHNFKALRKYKATTIAFLWRKNQHQLITMGRPKKRITTSSLPSYVSSLHLARPLTSPPPSLPAFSYASALAPALSSLSPTRPFFVSPHPSRL